MKSSHPDKISRPLSSRGVWIENSISVVLLTEPRPYQVMLIRLYRYIDNLYRSAQHSRYYRCFIITLLSCHKVYERSNQ